MEIVRESLAISMFLISIVEYNERKYFKCYLFIFFAIMFHNFAVLLLFVPLFLSNYFSNKIKWSLLIILIASSLFLESAMSFLISVVVSLVSIDLSFYDIAKEMTMFGYLYAFLRIAPVLFVMIFYRKKDLPYVFIKKRTLYSLASLYILSVFIRATTIPFMDRFTNYFIIFVILIVTGAIYDLVNKYVIKNFRFYSIVFISVISFLFYILPYVKLDPIFGVPWYKRYYPYYSIFSKKTDPDRERMTTMEGKEY